MSSGEKLYIITVTLDCVCDCVTVRLLPWISWINRLKYGKLATSLYQFHINTTCPQNCMQYMNDTGICAKNLTWRQLIGSETSKFSWTSMDFLKTNNKSIFVVFVVFFIQDLLQWNVDLLLDVPTSHFIFLNEVIQKHLQMWWYVCGTAEKCETDLTA